MSYRRGPSRYTPEASRDTINVYPTNLDDFLLCGHMFEVNKVLQQGGPTSAWVVPGSVVDAAVEKNLESMRDLGKPMDRSDYETLLERAWTEKNEEEDWDWERAGLDPVQLKDKIIEGGLLHYDEIAPMLKPVHVQQRVSVHIGDGIFLSGYLDYSSLMDDQGRHRIHDLKFSKDRKQKHRLPYTQAIVYTIAAQHGDPQFDVGAFQADYLIWGGAKVRYDPRPIVVTQAMINMTIDNARRFAKACRAGVFVRNTGSWKCSEKWCDQWSQCMGAETPKFTLSA